MADKIISDRAWKIIAERGWVGFGLLGLVFAIIGGSGKVPAIGDVPDHITQSIFLYFGIALIVFAASAYLFPPNHEAHRINGKTLPVIGKDLIGNKRTYDFRVGEPKSVIDPRSRGKLVLRGKSVTFRGTIKRKPPEGTKICLFTEGSSHGENTYWPQEYVNCEQPPNWWVTFVPGEFEEGESRIIRFYLVGNNAQAVISAYKTINNHHISQHGGKWEGITKTEFTDDIGKLSDAIVLRLVREAEVVTQKAV
jgi:hypothetical protein